MNDKSIRGLLGSGFYVGLLFVGCSGPSAIRTTDAVGTKSAPQHRAPSATGKGAPAVAVPSPEHTEALARPTGLHVYGLRSGNTRKICDGDATSPWYVSEERVIFVNKKSMTLDMCDLGSGRAKSIATIRFGEAGPLPEKVSLILSKDGKAGCLVELSEGRLGWQVVDLVSGNDTFVTRMPGEKALRAPPACDATPDWNYQEAPVVRLSSDGAQMVPTFASEDRRWLVGAVSPDATHEGTAAAFSTGKSALVFVLDAKTERVFQLREGPWPNPVDTGTAFGSDAVRAGIRVSAGTRIGALRTEGFIWVGPFLVELGVSTTRFEGEFAASPGRVVSF